MVCNRYQYYSNPCYRCPYLSICNSMRIDSLERKVDEIPITSILMGELLPEDNIGKDNDIYFCFSEPKIFKKLNGSWEEQGTFSFSFDGGIIGIIKEEEKE